MPGVIVDTSALLAYFDSSEPDHLAVVREIDGCGDLLVVSPYVVAELDYLVATRFRVGTELLVLAELSGGAWELPHFDIDDLKRAQAIVAKYADFDVGVADASAVVLAERYHTTRIVTLDRRHFDVLRLDTGSRFTVIP